MERRASQIAVVRFGHHTVCWLAVIIRHIKVFLFEKSPSNEVIMQGLCFFSLGQQPEGIANTRRLILCPRWSWHLQAYKAIGGQSKLQNLIHPHARRRKHVHSQDPEGRRSVERLDREKE